LSATPADPAAPSQILKGAVISGVVNAVINGAIQFVMLRGHDTIPLSVDAISAGTHTVLGAAVPLAVSLAMILTAVAHWTLKTPKKPFVPTTLWLVVKHGIFAFGALVAGAVVWQRVVGTVEVSVATAVIVLGVVAGLVATLVNYQTLSAVVEDAR
jgi:nucleoside recognition membrane protein YjiH